MRAQSVWNLLHRNQERLVVGTATTLIVLALLAHARSGFGKTISGHEPVLTPDSQAIVSTLSDVPRDPEFYRNKWREIANDFYAAHPVEPATQPVTVTTASLRRTSDDARESGPQVSTVAHIVPKPVITTMTTSVVAQPRLMSLVRPPAVFAAIAAGLLASWLFATLWPVKLLSERQSLEWSDAFRIELPSRWVQFRPTPFERLKSVILTIAYVGGVASAWTIISH